MDEDGSQEKIFENEVDPHGVSLVTYAASNTDVLHATTNGDYTVRRFDTFATKYCQIYRGHSDEVSAGVVYLIPPYLHLYFVFIDI